MTTVQRLAHLEAQMLQAADAHKATAALVQQMHDALMKPEPGYGQTSLLDRMARVTLDIESGKRTARGLVFVASLFAAIGAVAAALRFGISRN